MWAKKPKKKKQNTGDRLAAERTLLLSAATLSLSATGAVGRSGVGRSGVGRVGRSRRCGVGHGGRSVGRSRSVRRAAVGHCVNGKAISINLFVVLVANVSAAELTGRVSVLSHRSAGEEHHHQSRLRRWKGKRTCSTIFVALPKGRGHSRVSSCWIGVSAACFRGSADSEGSWTICGYRCWRWKILL